MAEREGKHPAYDNVRPASPNLTTIVLPPSNELLKQITENHLGNKGGWGMPAERKILESERGSQFCS